MAGLRDGVNVGHAQNLYAQNKVRFMVTIDGTDTLIGYCSSVAECVKNVKAWSGCSFTDAVRYTFQNIASLMEDEDRSK